MEYIACSSLITDKCMRPDSNKTKKYTEKKYSSSYSKKNNIIPFIKILKLLYYQDLLLAYKPVLQAIVENLLLLKYCISELSLVINGKKPKGSGHFGYSDIFILSKEGNNNVILELKYISLV
ncbi:hypothetical protein RhiirA4_482808 [Rhizophagus irregularis]|uniref:Uncharacterized protein n=1 Tax=Rhizophagus irregularis TaxID=588596 RepID=A0A2I1HLL9_9GLOM|nr:hypothetical protein RhiirA4_482808 [Rhizophagus irregularis]